MVQIDTSCVEIDLWKMVEAPGLVIPADVGGEFVQSSVCVATKKLKSTIAK